MFVRQSVRWSLPLVLFTLLAGLTGCGSGVDFPPLGQVTGKLTVDGEPIEGATIEFVPEEGGRPSMATTDDQGNYTLRWSPDAEGATIGTHTVVVRTERAPFSPEGDEGTPVEERLELLPPEYNDASTLKKEVAAGSQVIDLDLETNGFQPGTASPRQVDP